MTGPVPKPSPIRVLLADDHALVRQGLRKILEMEDGIHVVAEATNGPEAVALALRHQPDVVLMDINMPGGGGLEATRRLLAAARHLRVVALTIHDDDEYIFEILRAGARGYLLKDTEPAAVVAAVRAVAGGGAYLPPALLDRVLGAFRQEAGMAPVAWSTPSPAAGQPGRLTERESEILKAVGRGWSNRQIAASLFIAEKTVKNHVSNILRKLGLSDRTQAALYAVRTGLATPDDPPAGHAGTNPPLQPAPRHLPRPRAGDSHAREGPRKGGQP